MKKLKMIIVIFLSIKVKIQVEKSLLLNQIKYLSQKKEL